MSTTSGQQLTIVEHGNAGRAGVAHARERIAHALGHLSEPAGPVYLTLNTTAHHRHGPQATASVHVDIAGEVICAHASAPSLGAAIEAMHDRLRGQLERRTDHRLDRRRGRPDRER